MLELGEVGVRLGGVEILRDISFRLPQGDIGALLGPSGSGKTTLLRLVAGFQMPDNGWLRFANSPIARPGWMLPPEARQFAMVFQDHALLPHLDVAGNVGFGLHRLTRRERRSRVAEALEMVGLGSVQRRKPHELSGGQQQRVAVARALATRPRMMLLDEPFSSLDEDLRQQLQGDLRAWLKQAGVTALLVTHSQTEAYAVGDWIGVIGQGRLHQWDTPYNVYHQPRDRFVAGFVGEGVFIPGLLGPHGIVETEVGSLHASEHPVNPSPGAVDVLLRPDDLVLDEGSPLRARVVEKRFRGADILYRLQLTSGRGVLSLIPSHHDLALGDMVGLRLNLEHVICFPR